MPLCRDWGEGKLVRPLLDVSRQEIEDYVRDHRLTFMEDPSNLDTGIERNFLRREVLPLLEERWPSASQTLARSARHHAHAARLLQERAEQDLADADTIEVKFLASLSRDRQINLVRFWIARQGFPVPSERRLSRWLDTVHAAGADRVPAEIFEAYRMYRWRGHLHLVPPVAGPAGGAALALAPGRSAGPPGTGSGVALGVAAGATGRGSRDGP